MCWILQPLTSPVAGGAGTGPAASQQQQNAAAASAPLLLAGGDVSVGRPLKKGSTVGKADILIFNEQSVSSIHAKLQVQPGSSDGGGTEASFQHGAVSITDVSRYGTHLTRSDAQEQRLPSNEAVQLQDGDVLRFGSNSRYQLVQQPIALVASSSCQAQHPALQQQAAALNMQLCSSWVGAAGTTAAAAAAAALQEAYYVACPSGEVLTPTLLRGLVGAQGPLVTPAWVEAVAAKVVWPAAELPSTQQFTPELLLLPRQDGRGSSQGQAEGEGLVPSGWQAPSSALLSGFSLAFELGCQEDLVGVAAACGAQHVLLTKQPKQAKLAAQQQEAAAAGKATVLVLRSDWSASALQQPQKQHRATAAAKHLPSLSELQLLLAVANNTTAPLQAAVQAYAQEHGLPQQQQQQQQQQPQQQQQGRTAGAAGASHKDDDGGATEADETEEAADQQMPDGPAAPAPAASPAAADTAAAQGKGGSSLLPVTPVSQAPPADSGGPPQPTVTGDGWHAHGPSSSIGGRETQGRTTGSKRTAPTTSDAAAAPGSKRRKTAGSPTKSPLPLQRKQRQQQPANAAAAAGGGGSGASTDAATQQQQQQQQAQAQDKGVGCSAEIMVPLCMPAVQRQPQPPRNAAAAGDAGQQVPNFKAFRRRGQQEQQEQQPVAAVVLVAADAPHVQGPDVDAFLRDEKLRQDRVRKADELFNANIKAVKAPAAAGGRARKK